MQAMAVSLVAQVRMPGPSLFARSVNDIRFGCLSLARIRHHRCFSSTQSVQKSSVTRFQSADRLSGRTSLITGGSSGIGYAIAERFLQESASSIILVGRSQKRLEAAAADLRSSAGEIHTAEGTGTVSSNVSDRIRLLVGDVGEVASWMRELEQEMVRTRCYPF